MTSIGVTFNVKIYMHITFATQWGLCDHHLGLLSSEMRHRRPQHLIVCLGGHDLDVTDWDWSAEWVVAKLVTFLTQLRNKFSLKTVTILIIFQDKGQDPFLRISTN